MTPTAARSCAYNGMPTLESNRVYQVWLERDGEVVSQTLFSVGEDGTASPAVHDTLEDADAVLVTREAAGGARAPSEEPILRMYEPGRVDPRYPPAEWSVTATLGGRRGCPARTAAAPSARIA